jgi:hypothetical protein
MKVYIMKKITHRIILLFLFSLSVFCFTEYAYGTHKISDKKILSIININRPSKGKIIPVDMNKRLGATHVGGKYHFTNEPFIIEGCRKLHEMGYGIVKLWFDKSVGGYSYCSSWNLPEKCTYKQLAEHPYYRTCFEMPFSTIALSLGGAGLNTTEESAQKEEQEIYELCKYLLETYKNRNIEFILHNWEGDWIMRGGTGNGARWSRKSGTLIKAVDGDRYTVLVPSDSTKRAESMIKWFQARQRGG